LHGERESPGGVVAVVGDDAPETQYWPGGNADGSEVSSRVLSDDDTCPLPWLTWSPLAFLTIRVENTGSISPSNQICTSLGDGLTVAPTWGEEFSGNAWAQTAGVMPAASNTITTGRMRRMPFRLI